MNLTDITDETVTVTAMHVALVASNPTRLLGFIGRNTWTVPLAAAWPEDVTPKAGDVVSLTKSETGVYEATGVLGYRSSNPTSEHLSYGLPWDFQQVGWDGAMGSVIYSAVSVLPPSHVVSDDPRHVVYGNLGTSSRGSTAYWGHSTRWAYPGSEPARRISLLPVGPAPTPAQLTLLSALWPGDASVPVGSPLTVPLDYMGPDTVTVVDLPAPWIEALAAGTAGAIRFTPADTTPGLTSIAIGAHRSLTLHT